MSVRFSSSGKPLRRGGERWPKDPQKLTRPEEEVTGFISQGLTNRQIAEELTLSERTVDTHVGRILKKLGVQSREQVADLMAEQRPRGTISR